MATASPQQTNLPNGGMITAGGTFFTGMNTPGPANTSVPMGTGVNPPGAKFDVNTGQPINSQSVPISPAVSTPTAPATTTQPNPKTTNALGNLPGAPTTSTGNIPLSPSQQATYDAAVAGTKQPSPFQQGFNQTKASGTSAPVSKGAADSTIASTVTPTQNETPPAVNNFLDPNTNKAMAEQVQQLMEIVSPQATRDSIAQEMANLTAEKNVAAQEKMQLMNVKNVMAGTQQDIRDEVTKANGFATDSQVLALTTARNATLLKQAQFLQDQLVAQQDTIANDTALLASDKADAASQLSTRMGLMQYIQTNQNNQLNAFRQGIDTQIKTPGGLTALASNPASATRAEQVMGFAPGTIQAMAIQSNKNQALDNAQKQASINASNSTIRKNNFDMNGGGTYGNDVSTTVSGLKYFDPSNYSGNNKNAAISFANKNGIPVVNKDQADALSNIDNARLNQDAIKNQIMDLLPKDASGRPLGGANNKLSQFLQTNDALGAFNSWRTAAINSLRATAGSKGLRINQAEIQAATENDIPKITDTVGVAQQKYQNIMTMLDNAENAILIRDRSTLGPSGKASQTQPQSHPLGTTTNFNGHTYQSDGSQWVLIK